MHMLYRNNEYLSRVDDGLSWYPVASNPTLRLPYLDWPFKLRVVNLKAGGWQVWQSVQRVATYSGIKERCPQA